LGNDHTAPLSIELPSEVLTALTEMVKAMADGHAVTVVPTGRELSTAKAADLMNVSRPFVVKEIDSGRLRHRKVGAHRRVAFDDLIRYSQQMRAQQDDASEQLSDLTWELGLEYEGRWHTAPRLSWMRVFCLPPPHQMPSSVWRQPDSSSPGGQGELKLGG
jgi:excisionase family DNA binding protein